MSRAVRTPLSVLSQIHDAEFKGHVKMTKYNLCLITARGGVSKPWLKVPREPEGRVRDQSFTKCIVCLHISLRLQGK